MSTWKTRTVAAAAIMTGLGLGIAAIATAAPTPTPSPSATTSTATASVAKQLAHLREEERLARDVYTAIAKLYPATPAFSRIASSEQRHFDTMGLMLTRYGLSDPSSGLAAGSYDESGLTTLYAQLMTQSKASVAEAYAVGIAIEKTDIADLKAAIADSPPADVKAVYTNLQAGSDNHLATFTALRDGKAVGVGGGTGMQNGRRMTASAATGATATPGAGMGAGRAANGTGQGSGRSGTWTRPSDCPAS
jgi:hypothetical protein